MLRDGLTLCFSLPPPPSKPCQSRVRGGQGLTGRLLWLSDSSLSKSGSSITKESICVAKGPSESLSDSCCLEAEGAGGGRASGSPAAIARLLCSIGGWPVGDFSSVDVGGAEGSGSFKDFLEALAGRKRKVRTVPGGLRVSQQPQSTLETRPASAAQSTRLALKRGSCQFFRFTHKYLAPVYAWHRIFSLLG